MNTIPATSTPFFYGLPNSAAKAYFVCRRLLENRKSVIFVCADTDPLDFEEAAREFLPPHTGLLNLAGPDTSRWAALHELLTAPDKPYLICISYENLLRPIPAKNEFQSRTFTLYRGNTLRRQELLNQLEDAGYTRDDYAEAPGQYAARGSVVDIFCLNTNLPLRLYFSGNRLEMISAFDLDTQNTLRQEDQAVILPLRRAG